MAQHQDLRTFHASSRRDSRSHAATRVIRRNTNRRHMSSDHHGRTAGSQPCWSEPWTRSSARTGAKVGFAAAGGVAALAFPADCLTWGDHLAQETRWEAVGTRSCQRRSQLMSWAQTCVAQLKQRIRPRGETSVQLSAESRQPVPRPIPCRRGSTAASRHAILNARPPPRVFKFRRKNPKIIVRWPCHVMAPRQDKITNLGKTGNRG